MTVVPECGCYATHDVYGEHSIEYCPKHEAADDLLAACEAVATIINLDGQFHPSHWKPILSQVKQAIAKAKGYSLNERAKQ